MRDRVIKIKDKKDVHINERASEPAKRASEPAERAPKPAGRASEPGGRPGGDGERNSRKSVTWSAVPHAPLLVS